MLCEPIRKVGVINCYKDSRNIATLVRAVRMLGCAPVVFDVSDPYWVHVARASPIQHWIASGSEWNVVELGAPKLPPSLLLDPQKHWFFVCYSMQSVLHQLGARIHKLPLYKKEAEAIDSRLYWRNHGWAFDSAGVQGLRLTDPMYAKDGSLMRCLLGNAILTQYHPERTLEGLEEMRLFLRY